MSLSATMLQLSHGKPTANSWVSPGLLYLDAAEILRSIHVRLFFPYVIPSLGQLTKKLVQSPRD